MTTETLSSRLANITLPDTDGREVLLGSLWATSPTVLVFLRHYGCIFCREHVAQLREHEQEFRQRGANLAAIGLGDLNYARIFREDTGITFPLLVDAGRIAYRAVELRKTTFFGLFTRENFGARSRARAAGHHQHKLGKDPFQLGASFVFAQGNKDLFVHLSAYTGDNAPVSSLLKAIP